MWTYLRGTLGTKSGIHSDECFQKFVYGCSITNGVFAIGSHVSLATFHRLAHVQGDPALFCSSRTNALIRWSSSMITPTFGLPQRNRLLLSSLLPHYDALIHLCPSVELFLSWQH